MGGGKGMVKVGGSKKTKDEADLGPMKEEKRWFLIFTRQMSSIENISGKRRNHWILSSRSLHLPSPKLGWLYCA